MSTTIESVTFSTAYFKPGEPVRWSVGLKSDTAVRLTLVTTIRCLGETQVELRQAVEFGPGEFSADLTWQPPASAPRGYGVDLRLETTAGELVAAHSAAFDVLERWTQHPRYGFLTNFEPNRTSGEAALDDLLGYHINGLQFYDWMYRHDQYLTAAEPYNDPLGRQLSFQTVETLIAAAHARGMAAMPYTAVYAASIPFYEQHPDWALFQPDGKPLFFGDNFLVIMDPRPDSPWTHHLLGEFDRILVETGFDGIHLDQYGSPKTGYDAQGNSYPVDQPLADLIDATHTIVASRRGADGAVIFNAVTNWPVETVAPADEDVVYIEVWPPYTSFNDLSRLVVDAQSLGGGKPVVIAAYIDPFNAINVRLNDAILFANGSGHIELGEIGGYLSDAYFPRYSLLDDDLKASLRQYYEFAIRYQNVIGPQTRSADAAYSRQIRVAGVETSPDRLTDRVMTAVRASDHHLAVSLINLLGIGTGEWAGIPLHAPTVLVDTAVEIGALSAQAARVWYASPDRPDFALQPLAFTQDGETLKVTLPSLQYWGMILIEWSE